MRKFCVTGIKCYSSMSPTSDANGVAGSDIVADMIFTGL